MSSERVGSAVEMMSLILFHGKNCCLSTKYLEFSLAVKLVNLKLLGKQKRKETGSYMSSMGHGKPERKLFYRLLTIMDWFINYTCHGTSSPMNRPT